MTTPQALLTPDHLAYLTPQERAELSLLTEPAALWKPYAGPQAAAYLSEADELFYGGAAGGGKTDLAVGLAFTAHHSSIIFRREYPQLRGIIDRGNQLVGNVASYNSQDHIWRFKDGRTVELGAVQFADDVTKYQGRPHDLIVFDEVSNFLKQQYRFLIGWNRSARPGQRVRVVATGNPPMTVEGEWVVDYWAPWLKDEYPNPALPGELRWFIVIDDKDIECPDNKPVFYKGDWVYPRSRTFIPAKLEDNPALAGTGYKAILQGLPEPEMRALLKGDFTINREDNPRQVCPTRLVRAAMERWKELEAQAKADGKEHYRPTITTLERTAATPTTRQRDIIVGKPLPLSALGVDVARGGADKTVLAPRYGTWCDTLRVYTGKETPDGPSCVPLILPFVEKSGIANVDGIGAGSGCVDTLRAYIGERCNSVIFSQGSDAMNKGGTYGFSTLRSQAYWQFRELLEDEDNPIALPPDDELLADLCAPTYEMLVTGVKVEPKDKIKERLGRSPDKADAVVLAFMLGQREMHLYNYSIWGGKV
jgi:hypothetical protein